MGEYGSRRAPLSGGFTRLWTASVFTNLADGITLAAGPLLVSSLTDDPVLIGSAVFVQQLPWLLFSLISGVYVDRLDRKRVLVLANAVRALVVAVLTAAIATDVVSVPIVYAAFFLLGTCETLVDNTSSTMVPTLVEDRNLPRANARIVALQTGVNEFLGPPLGASLFAFAVAVPFGVNAVAFALAAVVLAALRRPASTGPRERRPLWTEIREGVRWSWNHRVLRMLAVTLCGMNITLMSAFAVLVLYARERLGLGEVGYGVLLAAMALGGLVGTAIIGPLRRWLADSMLLRVGLVLETATHAVLALVTDAWAAGVTLAIFGLHSSVWGIVSLSWRQRIVPDHLRGRVTSVHLLFAVGGAALGSLLGGPLVSAFGITAPFWTSAALMTVLAAVAWRAFGRNFVDRPIAEDVPTTPSDTSTPSDTAP